MTEPTQLSLYNQALTRHLGQRKLAALTENNESRRALDDNYSAVIDECLEQGYWRHARRDAMLTGSDVSAGDFDGGDFSRDFAQSNGYQYAYPIMDDCLQLFMLSLTEDRAIPFNDYKYQNGVIVANFDTLYVTYISNDPAFGLDLSLWSPLFSRWVGAALAESVCYRLTQDKSLVEVIEKREKKFKRAALNKDAMEGPTTRPPMGSWVSARFRGQLDTRDRRIY